MNTDDRPTATVRSLLDGQLLGVLATHGDREPYSSLVAFVVTDDLRYLLFVTGRSTRKWSNLSQDGRASLLVDSRTNRAEDFANAAAVTALGAVEEVAEDGREAFLQLFLAKHPHLDRFATAPSCVLLRLRVHTYVLVTRFQHVVEVHLDP